MGERIEIPEEVLFKPVGDEIILLNLESGIYYGLDAVGSRFWSILEEERDVDAALVRMGEEFEVDAATLERDCRELLGELRQRGLVKVLAVG